MEIMMDFGFQLSHTWHRMFQYSSSENNGKYEDFLGSPVVKTPNFQCRGHGFSLWLGK